MNTIAQFRVLDFGMEMCRITVQVSSRNESQNILKGSRENSVSLDLWNLEINGPLNPGTLSWSTRPLNKIFLETLLVKYGSTVQTAPFPCTALQYYAFEVTCSATFPTCETDILGVGGGESGESLLVILEYPIFPSLSHLPHRNVFDAIPNALNNTGSVVN